jgi:hypothetical protein
MAGILPACIVLFLNAHFLCFAYKRRCLRKFDLCKNFLVFQPLLLKDRRIPVSLRRRAPRQLIRQVPIAESASDVRLIEPYPSMAGQYG